METVLLVGGDDNIAFGLAVVAHALHAVGLGQLVDDLPMFSVHWLETVTPLWLFSLQTLATHVHQVCISQSLVWCGRTWVAYTDQDLLWLKEAYPCSLVPICCGKALLILSFLFSGIGIKSSAITYGSNISTSTCEHLVHMWPMFCRQAHWACLTCIFIVLY